MSTPASCARHVMLTAQLDTRTATARKREPGHDKLAPLFHQAIASVVLPTPVVVGSCVVPIASTGMPFISPSYNCPVACFPVF